MHNKCTILLIATLFSITTIHAGIICPNDITIGCYNDYDNTDVTGTPTLLGQHAWFFPKYIDVKNINACNIGTIERTWFGDQNDNDTIDDGEPSCIQLITLDGDINDVNLSFPSDVTYACQEDIASSKPTWTSAPCDAVGYTVDEDHFEFAPDACYKILRHFKVINWCVYDPINNPGVGEWNHTQVIKVIDNDQPIIENCEEKHFEVDADCLAEVTLSNIATEMGDCPSPNIRWTAIIDLWADGTTDYQYGSFETGDFYIEPSQLGQEISFTLPEKIQEGKHKIVWKASDACGNIRSCSTQFYTEDKKAPTPYCRLVVSTALSGMNDTLGIWASDFDLGSFDNCTPSEDIALTFSTLEGDNVREIHCGNNGVRFFRVYATDNSGNQNYCEVYLVALDNGSCNSRIALEGRILNYDELTNAQITSYVMEGEDMVTQQLITEQDGSFVFDDLALYDSYQFEAKDVNTELQIDLVDLVMIQQYFIGLRSLDYTQLIAADVDGDEQIKVADIREILDVLLGRSDSFSGGNNTKMIPHQNIINQKLINKGSISISEIPGRIDFVGVSPGNISESEVQFRENKTLELVWDQKYTNGYELSSKQSIEIEGAYVAISGIENLEDIKLHESFSNVHFNENKKELRAILVKNEKIAKGEVLISSYTDISNINISGYSINGALDKINWNLQTKDNIKSFYPTISTDEYVIDQYAEIINVMDTEGKPLQYRFSEGVLRIMDNYSGLFLVSYQTKNGDSKIAKLIKY